MKNLIAVVLFMFGLNAVAQTAGDFDFVGRTLEAKSDGHINQYKLHCTKRNAEKDCEEVQVIKANSYNDGADFYYSVTETKITLENYKKMQKLMTKAVKKDVEIFIGGFTVLTIVGAVITEEPAFLFFLPLAIPADIITAPFITAHYVGAKLNPMMRVKIGKFLKSGFKDQDANDMKTVRITQKTSDALRNFFF